MGRPKTILGADAAYPAGMSGQTVFDTDPTTLPPLTRALREAWGTGPNSAPNPIATAPAMAAILAAVHDLETRVTTLET